jgi:hypothetical protein
MNDDVLSVQWNQLSNMKCNTQSNFFYLFYVQDRKLISNYLWNPFKYRINPTLAVEAYHRRIMLSSIAEELILVLDNPVNVQEFKLFSERTIWVFLIVSFYWMNYIIFESDWSTFEFYSHPNNVFLTKCFLLFKSLRGKWVFISSESKQYFWRLSCLTHLKRQPLWLSVCSSALDFWKRNSNSAWTYWVWSSLSFEYLFANLDK